MVETNAMKNISKVLFPLAVVLVWIALFLLGKKGYYPFPLIPGNAFDYSIIPMMLLFGLAFWILNKNLFKPLLALMDARTQQIQKAEKKLAEAEKAYHETVQTWEKKIFELRKDYQEKRNALLKEMEMEKTHQIEEAKAQLQKQWEEAMAQLAREKKDSQAILEKEIDKLAKQLAAKVLGRSIA